MPWRAVHEVTAQTTALFARRFSAYQPHTKSPSRRIPYGVSKCPFPGTWIEDRDRISMENTLFELWLFSLGGLFGGVVKLEGGHAPYSVRRWLNFR